MATLSRTEPKHMYSWWWVSHISPKNSKWLQENLTDMDSKVKQMIKVIEVDEDSFARRAEMYYKKRPELMKLVEEFYRAYRALAERYDHATGVIRQAHKTMSEVFPNQVPGLESDEGPFSSANDSDHFSPEMSAAIRASGDLDELHKGAIGLSPSDFHSTERNGPFVSRATPFGKFAEGRSRRALNFPGADKKGVTTQKNEIEPRMAQGHSESERIERYEEDIQALKDSLAKLEAEKEAGLLQYQQSMQRLSNLESEVLRAQEDSRGFHEQASKAEAEVQSLRESLSNVEGEREASLLQYQQCLDKISSLESDVSRFQEDALSLDKRACEAEKESQVLREELAQLKAEKGADLAKYMESLEKIGSLENKLLLAEDEASVASKRADSAEKEVAALKEALARITEEKEAFALQYKQSLEKIASLENEIALSREEIAKLRDEMDLEIVKLKGVEEQCLVLERSNKSMQTELDSVLIKLGFQNQELSGKQKELGRLWTYFQEERVRFVEAETAFKTLQGLHSQTREELRSVAAELQKRVQLLKDLEIHNQDLEGELQKFRDENKSLNELNLSSAVSIKSLQDDILNLKEGKAKLEEDLELRLDQRNALQQEIYCLKEELKSLSKKHGALLEQMESVGFQPECFTSSVKGLQDLNSKLKESCQSSKAEISVLLEKLNMMEKLIEKKATLEQSLSELSAELEDARGKVKALEESCQLLMTEKSTVLTEKATLISQLAITTENLEKLSERNTLLENSLFDANAELEALRTKSKDLEGSCRLLSDEKSILVSERQALELKLETAHQTLQELGKKHADLEQSYLGMEEGRKSTLKLVEDLRTSLAAEKRERDHSTHSSRMQMAQMENKICALQELVEQTRGELGEELDNAVNAQFEIFILRNSLQDLRETNSSLLKKCEKLLETSRLSEKLVSQLEYENFEQQEEVGFLSDQIKRLRVGMFQLLKVLEIDLDYVFEDNLDDDKLILHRILAKLDDTRNSLCRAWDENEKLVIEKSVLLTLLGQLKHQVADLKIVIDTLQREFRTRNDQLSSLQRDMPKLLQSNEELLLRIREGNHKEDLLASEMQSLRAKLQEMQGVCQGLEKENSRIVEENRSLTQAFTFMQEEKHKVEHENSCLVSDMVTLDTLSLIFKSSIVERSEAITHLTDNIDKLGDNNGALQDKLRTVEGLLGKHQGENTSLRASLEKYVDELEEVKAINSQFEREIADGEDMLSRKVIELMEVEAVKDDRQKQIHELSERYEQQERESECLRESMQDLDAEIARIHEKYSETTRAVKRLRSDVKKGKDETALWETVAGTFFTELQATSVREALYREKFNELTREYECLEEKSYANGLEVEQLREMVGSLKGENGEMRARWAGYVPAMESLRSSVASLERHVVPSEADDGDDKDSPSSYRLKEGAEATAASSDEFSDLQDIAARITAVENKVIETKKLAEERSPRSLRSLSSRSLRRTGRTSRRYSPESTEERPHSATKPTPETHETGGELLMKDIMLDQASESVSSGWKSKKPAYNTGSGDQILELWKTVEQDPRDIHAKELRIDSLEISTRFSGSNDFESDHKVLERLSSDVQKLTNLQITVQDLKQKVGTVENTSSAKGKATEYAGVKDQLEEAETAIAKLLDVNGRLVKNVEDRSSDSSRRPTSSSIGGSSDIGGSGRRRRVSEQARRCSEKIGRLQLEVQKIQFLLLKLDGGSKTGRSSGTRGLDCDRKVVLRDYLYGVARTPRRRKKVHFCACVQPPTSGD